jgi:hypothetical protein
MARINLSIHLEGGGRVPEIGALANVYDVTPRRKDRENRENLMVPCDPGRSLPVDLSPGRYIVEAKLPSGRLLKKEVEVEAQDQYVTLKLDSPHEWLSMQTLMGNVPHRQVLERREKILGAEFAPERVATWIVSTKLPYAEIPIGRRKEYLKFEEANINRGYFFLEPKFAEKRIFDENNPVFPFAHAISPHQYSGPLRPIAEDKYANFFKFNLTQMGIDRVISEERRYFEVENNPDFVRLYVWTQTSGGSAQYSVLPVPWYFYYGEEVDVQVCIDTKAVQSQYSKNYDRLHRISIVAEDQFLASIIGYLGKGDLPAASSVLKTAEHMLFGKRTNPFAAAAGAYVMLSQEDLTVYAYWHRWIDNLHKFFDWLPDGAIQWAWLKLADPNSGLKEIRDCLMEAYWRGLPYYSAGVKLLLDGLTIFSDNAKAEFGQPDSEIEEALKIVRQLAMRTNMSQPFTSVIIS